MKIKICGFCRKEDIEYAISKEVDYLGIILYPGSKRFVPFERAISLLKEFKNSNVSFVAVTVNEDKYFLSNLLNSGFDYVQLHGEESLDLAKSVGLERVIKAFRIGRDKPFIHEEWKKAHAILLDAYKKGYYGGTGTTFDWNIARFIKEEGFRIFLSGGLNPDNVIQAIEEVRPFGVDVSSGVERAPCEKDLTLMDKFIERVRSIEND